MHTSDPDPDPTATLTLSLNEAETLSNGLSDILCWCRGFIAGRGQVTDNDPMGIESVREMNIRLKAAIRRATP
jgi:hypothetical protein